MIARPHGQGTLFVEPIHGDGLTAGIWVEHDDRLPKVYARVVAVSESAEGLRPDDLIVVIPHAADVVEWTGGKVWVMHENSVRAVFDCPDGLPYFTMLEEAA